jgi:tripartite ATP-independent transporter DctM subunit
MPSLVAVVGAGIAAGWLFKAGVLSGVPDLKDDVILGYSGVVGVTVSYLAALTNRKLKLGMLSVMAEKVVLVLVPPLALIFLVLGTIFVGIATPTEGGGMGALGAMLLAISNGRLSSDLLKQAMNSTTRLSCFVLFILIGSSVFSLTFRAVNGDLWVEHLLTSLPGGQIGFLIVVNILFFGLAFFLDFFELAFILVPLVGPVAEKMGIDLIWFGVLLSVNMQTSFMHPPFGFALFYLRSVAPKAVKTSDIYWGSVPFVGIQLLMVALIIAFPSMISVASKTDMKEQIELKIDMGDSDINTGIPDVEFIVDDATDAGLKPASSLVPPR